MNENEIFEGINALKDKIVSLKKENEELKQENENLRLSTSQTIENEKAAKDNFMNEINRVLNEAKSVLE